MKRKSLNERKDKLLKDYEKAKTTAQKEKLLSELDKIENEIKKQSELDKKVKALATKTKK